jgi:hypothetical protein
VFHTNSYLRRLRAETVPSFFTLMTDTKEVREILEAVDAPDRASAFRERGRHLPGGYNCFKFTQDPFEAWVSYDGPGPMLDLARPDTFWVERVYGPNHGRFQQAAAFVENGDPNGYLILSTWVSAEAGRVKVGCDLTPQLQPLLRWENEVQLDAFPTLAWTRQNGKANEGWKPAIDVKDRRILVVQWVAADGSDVEALFNWRTTDRRAKKARTSQTLKAPSSHELRFNDKENRNAALTRLLTSPEAERAFDTLDSVALNIFAETRDVCRALREKAAERSAERRKQIWSAVKKVGVATAAIGLARYGLGSAVPFLLPTPHAPQPSPHPVPVGGGITPDDIRHSHPANGVHADAQWSDGSGVAIPSLDTIVQTAQHTTPGFVATAAPLFGSSAGCDCGYNPNTCGAGWSCRWKY